jgi:transcriptional regulator with XRE-family HTH domain
VQDARPAQPENDDAVLDMPVRLGATIRQLRRGRGLTLVGLADLADLSNPFLSQLERGLTRASMDSLHRIARALGTTAPGLLAASTSETSAPRVLFTRASDGRTPAGDEPVTPEGQQARALVSGNRAMYPVELLVTSGVYDEFHQHEFAEMIYLLSGRLEVDLDTEGVHRLSTGDNLYLSGGVRHRWRAPSRRRARALVVQAGRNPHA